MGCGCTGAVPLTVGLTDGFTDERGQQRARAVMCGTCPAREGDRCAPAGHTVRRMVLDGGCPRGRHPDAAGVVRWLGTEWYGVPAALRWAYGLARRWLGLPRLTGPLPGCGCHKPSKDDWLRFAAAYPRAAGVIQAVGRRIARRSTPRR